MAEFVIYDNPHLSKPLKRLTINKKYNVIIKANRNYLLRNDKGQITWYNERYFNKDPESYRKMAKIRHLRAALRLNQIYEQIQKLEEEIDVLLTI